MSNMTYKFTSRNKSSKPIYEIDSDSEITIITDDRELTIYLSEVSKEGKIVHHVTDGKADLYIKVRDLKPDIVIYYGTKKEMSDKTGVYPL